MLLDCSSRCRKNSALNRCPLWSSKLLTQAPALSAPSWKMSGFFSIGISWYQTGSSAKIPSELGRLVKPEPPPSHSSPFFPGDREVSQEIQSPSWSKGFSEAELWGTAESTALAGGLCTRRTCSRAAEKAGLCLSMDCWGACWALREPHAIYTAASSEWEGLFIKMCLDTFLWANFPK